MVSVASSAHIRLTGFNSEGIDAYSPLEDQVTLTYRAASHYASANGFTPYTHRGVPGRKGPMIMKRVTDSLFDHPDSTVRSKLNGLITQVLRKTDAVVCVKRPADGDRESMPEWFVADRMPPNLTIVALSHAGAEKSTKVGVGPTPVIPTRAEQKLTAHEAGEDLPPGEVTVKTRTPEERIAPLKDFLDNRAKEHEDFVEEIFRLIAAHAPVGSQELKFIMGRPDTKSTSAVAAVQELAKADRIVSRIEEDSERRIRGGGEFPKGKRILLWAPAPGPVPERTALPPGVEPKRAASYWDKEKKERLDKLCDAVIDVMNRRVPLGQPRVKSVGRIAEAAGLTPEETRTALDRLIQLELVYKGERSGNYHLTERRRGPVTPKDEPEPVIAPYVNGSPEQNAAREEASQPTVPEATVAPATTRTDLDAMTEEVIAVIQRHIQNDDSAQLREQLQAAQETIAKQAKIITGLKGVIAAMEE